MDLEPLCSPAFCRLEKLYLENNNIVQVPDALINAMQGLLDLNLENNSIKALPTILGFHAKLKNLRVIGNPMKSINQRTIEKGTQELLAVLRNRHNQGQEVEVTKNVEQFVQKMPQPLSSQQVHDLTTKSQVSTTEMELVGLKAKIDYLAQKLEVDFNTLSQAQRFAAKKDLQKLNAERIKLERKLN